MFVSHPDLVFYVCFVELLAFIKLFAIVSTWSVDLTYKSIANKNNLYSYIPNFSWVSLDHKFEYKK